MVVTNLSLEDIDEVFDRVQQTEEDLARREQQHSSQPNAHEDLDRFQRRQRDAEEVLKFEREQGLGVRPPRTKQEVGDLHGKNLLIYKDLVVNHKAQVEMLRKEHDNFTGHETVCIPGQNTALRYAVQCVDKEVLQCEGGFVASYRSGVGWKFIGVSQHCKECQDKVKLQNPAERSTPFTFRDLALITDVQEVVYEDFSAPSGPIGRRLQAYIPGKLGDKKMFELRRELQRQLVGTASQAAQDLPGLMRVLEEDGHDVQVTVVNQASMIQIILRHRQNQFEAQQSKFPVGQRRRWGDVKDDERVKAEDLVKDDSPSTQYVVGWSIVFKSAKAMVPFLTKVFFTDATFMRSKVGGALYCTVAADGNNHIVVFGISWFWGGEGRHGWNTHFQVLKDIIPPGSRVIMDGNVSAIAALMHFLPLCIIFMCSVHFAKNITKSVLKTFFNKALKAPTQQEFDRLKSGISDADFQSLIARHEPARLFMLLCGELHGHHCQSIAESLNKAIMDGRLAQTLTGMPCGAQQTS